MTKPQNIIAQVSKNVKKIQWECLVDDCKENAINSHLIQRNGLLSNIAINGHLIEIKMVDAYKWNSKEPPFNFSLVGIKNALSHKVFCNNHDTEIFKPIENEKKDFKTYISFLLFSYRAICAEIRKKMVNIENHTRLINSKILDGKINKEQLQLIINGNKLGITDLRAMKEMLEDEIQNEEGKYSFYAYKYDSIEVYASAAFSATSIELPKEEGSLDLENLYIHILPLYEETLILVGYHNDYKNDEMIEYCESWSELDKKQLEVKLTNLFATSIENWGVSPSLYNDFKEKNKKQYIKELTKNSSYFGIAKTTDFNLFEKKNYPQQ
ncbi:hypothetical protein [Tenacibaculum sp. 47A_GOM-205m]|uniref:hypothetical protein n=1 Tax=Tenacibaculum sp. 47A_GOM-205m TaxID=1380384 RepID=UPI00048B5F9B|nr:hypothetical protein [Tenacibaculum sp. 47A_GOM-205m]